MGVFTRILDIVGHGKFAEGRKGVSAVARKIKDKLLDSRETRRKLPPRGKPYLSRTSDRNIHLGYRRLKGRAGTWCRRLYDGGGKYRYEPIGDADDLADADGVEILDFWQALAKAGAPKAVSAGPYTVDQACDDYLAYLRSDGRSEAAIRDAEYRIDPFVRSVLGTRQVETLKAKDYREWLAGVAKTAPRLRTKPGKAQKHRQSSDDRARKATANRVWTPFKAALNHAFKEGMVKSDAEWRKVRPFKDAGSARIRYLQIAEAKRFINACDADFRLPVQAALATGARWGEITKLRAADFDADASTVFIAQSKSGKARHVRLSGEGVKFFKQACAGRAGDELIFRKADGGEWKKSHQARPMADACERAKITPPISFHILRHTYASHMVKSGAPLHVVALNLGHISKDGQPDVRMVTRHYAHLESTHVAKLIEEHAPRFGFKPDRVAALPR
jgi:integrase